MSYWFSESDDELAADRKWDTGTGFVLPTNADRREAFKRVHLVESELIQASSDELELIESELIQASSDELELIGEMLDRPLPLRSYCAIDGGRPIDPPVALLMPIRLWEQDSSLFGDVNCGICRGRYLYTLRKQQHGLERAQSLEILWLERYTEVNPECAKHHHTEVAANNLLVCMECGRWGYELQRLGHTVYLLGSPV